MNKYVNRFVASLRECFVRDTKRKTILVFVAFVFLMFQAYRTFIKPLDPMLLRPLHTVGMILICYLGHPITEKIKNKEKYKWLNIFDYIVYASIPVLIYYFIANYERLNLRIRYLDPLTTMDVVVGIFMTLVVLEGIRRSLGMVLTVFISIFIVYGFTSKYLPGILYYRGLNIDKAVDLFIMSTDGIFGSALGAAASFMFWIMLFGAVFAECGGGRVLVDLGMRAGSKTKDNSGPAKAAVIASGLMGMVSGSAAANVAGTGVITIPLMKKVGYSPEEAGAVESMASTGGQIMPPIMGTGAFLMAEMLGISYFTICKAAIIPALTYYFSIFVIIHFIAKGRKASAGNQIVDISTERILPRLYLLLPVVVLVYMIIAGFTIQRAALFALGTAIVLCFVGPKKNHVRVTQVVNSILGSTQRVADIGIPIAGCGIIVGVVNISGIATRLSKLIIQVGSDQLWLGLAITALGCMILGMALPTVAAYLTAYVMFMPTLISLGVDTLPANMFIFYFGIFAQITPPVCVASYTAAGIAGGSSWKTGWKGFMFAIGAFLAPFVFVYQPSILLIGTLPEILKNATILVAGVFFVSLGVAGHFIMDMSKIERILFIVAGILIEIPETITDIVGIVLVVVLTVWQIMRNRRKKAAGAA